ncbi:phosphocholine-specific phospholipase C [Algoriphagus sp. A40]|uniref:phosphocholine-specific phospholipase C n=1 Tax=Algoriphagus sp. A40 TaxID=1945863 RepID=UPI0009842526|nr:phospholipase C, phosphocholine-specific [Algoriphagus sp. A40]OOG77907.1 phospholipase C, phosphocholine-specific [Algoriphagus sp. A40]
MTESRREFLKKAALLGGAVGIWQVLPGSIERALAISPDPGTTFYDAEHVVMLMQENRSFDHCFGTLRGVRGFGDPRAITIPGKFPVWMQPDKDGNRFGPMRLDLNATKATWMGGVPHSWTDQVDARNEGKYDGWIEAKRPGKEDFRQIPLTMGYHTREDVPFYYALADAFTVFDQHFCAALTGTTTNRSYFWTGKTHGENGEKAKVRNGELNYENEADWTTFPERLEELGISWRVYQNEISLDTLVEDDSLLSNFTDNNLEWFKQYHVWFSPSFYEFLQHKKIELEEEFARIDREGLPKDADDKFKEELQKRREGLPLVLQYLEKYDPKNFDKVPDFEKRLHEKAFTVNSGDPDFHRIEKIKYTENGQEQEVSVPKGDIFHQFRKDVKEGKLPAVTWLVAPQKFSDHPSAPWYGAWYVSEVMDILTQNPEVWKKTIFILNYDENDGYFDHIPPFVAPNPKSTEEGIISKGLDVSGEFVTLEEELKAGFEEEKSRQSPVGLGFRVPLIVASPWTRGGWVNSQVSDITSTIQFLETFLSKKTGKKVEEPNISSWRKTVSGDLTSAFRPYLGEALERLDPIDRNSFMQKIHKAQFKGLPENFMAIPANQAKDWSESRLRKEGILPMQEAGTRPSNALNYDLRVSGKLENGTFTIRMEASNSLFGKDAWGAPFQVFAPGKFRNAKSGEWENVRVWNFTVSPGDALEYSWNLADFENSEYHLRVYGPNGFYREFSGNAESRGVELDFQPNLKLKGHRKVILAAQVQEDLSVQLKENAYRTNEKALELKAGKKVSEALDFESSQGWYDFTVQGQGFSWAYAGRLENGLESISDPLLGGEV